jgi:hypothetical protein
MKCPRCQHENEAGAKFCEECATPLARACTKCGRQLSPAAKFCPECAHPTAPSAARAETCISPIGRPSIPPEQRFLALVGGYLLGITSERKLVMELQCNMALRWFVGLNLDQDAWDASTFSQNRRRRFDEAGLLEQLFDDVASSASSALRRGFEQRRRPGRRQLARNERRRPVASAPAACRPLTRRIEASGGAHATLDDVPIARAASLGESDSHWAVPGAPGGRSDSRGALRPATTVAWRGLTLMFPMRSLTRRLASVTLGVMS